MPPSAWELIRETHRQPDFEVNVSDQKKKMTIMFAAVIVAGGLIGFAARATDRDKTVAPSPQQTQGTLFDDPDLATSSDLGLGGRELFVKMMLSVLIVVGLGAGALYLSKKVLPNVTKACGKEIRVVETTYLGPRKALHLVEIGGQRLLIGSTNESIAALAHIGDTWLDLSKQEIDHTVGA